MCVIFVSCLSDSETNTLLHSVSDDYLWMTGSAKCYKCKPHQQFLSFFGLKQDKVGLYVHVDVAAVVVDVSVLAHYPDVVIS